MKTIQIGKNLTTEAPALLDLETLFKTRALIQANSGGGKSWLIRRIAEQLFGTVPVIIIDPEGEFATLREKFGFVLVGKGGETPADPRSASLVCHKLLELGASAVIDLYEMNPADRHLYVKNFCQAGINAPKSLWKPTVFIFDEAHIFAPERGKGESCASESLVGFATRGRKRRFCSIFATQRLAKLRKDVTAELRNRLIGQTFEADDLKSAAELLGITGKESFTEFCSEMRLLTEGKFYCFGRALSREEKLLVKIGPVQTSHEIEQAEYGGDAPPTPDKIKHLLPKLADLPKQAEEAALTEGELRKQIANLKREVQAAKQAAPVTEREIKIPLVSESDMKLIGITAAKFDKIIAGCEALTNEAREAFKVLNGLSGMLERARQFTVQPAPRQASRPAPRANVPPIPPTHPAPVNPDQNGELSPGESAVLNAIAQYPEGVTTEDIAVLTGYKATSRKEYLRRLRNRGFVWNEGNNIRANEAGLAALGSAFKPLPTGSELVDYWRERLDPGEAKVFGYVITETNGEFERDETMEAATGYKQTSLKEYIRRLVGRHILESVGRGRYRLTSRFDE